MKQIKLISKLGLTVIAITAIAVAVAIQAYNIQAADAQAKLPNNSVTSQTIVNGQVQTQDLASGAIQLNIHEVRGEVLTLDPGRTGTAIAFCPDGEILTGGGFETDYGVRVGASAQRGNGDNAWVVEGANDVGSIPLHMEAAAYCLDPTIP